MLEGRGKGILVPYTVACGKAEGADAHVGTVAALEVCGRALSVASVFSVTVAAHPLGGEDTLCKDADARLKMREQIAGASARLTADFALNPRCTWKAGAGWG